MLVFVYAGLLGNAEPRAVVNGFHHARGQIQRLYWVDGISICMHYPFTDLSTLSVKCYKGCQKVHGSCLLHFSTLNDENDTLIGLLQNLSRTF